MNLTRSGGGGGCVACGGGTYRAVVLLLQQRWHISSNRHLLGQLLILHADPPPQLLQEAQQTRPALSTRLQVGPANKHHPLTRLLSSSLTLHLPFAPEALSFSSAASLHLPSSSSSPSPSGPVNFTSTFIIFTLCIANHVYVATVAATMSIWIPSMRFMADMWSSAATTTYVAPALVHVIQPMLEEHSFIRAAQSLDHLRLVPVHTLVDVIVGVDLSLDVLQIHRQIKEVSKSSKLFEVVRLMGTEALDRGRWSVSEQEAIKKSL
ncbi:hypothetical protein EYF80_021257 [Liparis tanakae]|uniref:Uncharacterized protein n=1 Tax=Liparis tanakae TaxID=230148 RepID=A0A4Z2HUA9_9TELE|nr:hypothetical protein EYF80_021257 [Liparis tanakae]